MTLAAAAGAAVLAGASYLAIDAANAAPSDTVQGFALSVLAPTRSLDLKADCPNGFNQGPDLEKTLARFPPEQRERIRNDGNLTYRALARRGPTGPNVCLHPLLDPDSVPFIVGASGRQAGLDLHDPGAKVQSCQQPRLRNAAGEAVNNQYAKVSACVRGRQGLGGGFTPSSGIRGGNMTVLVSVAGVDSWENDPDVVVGVYSGRDPTLFDAASKQVAGATFRILDDPRFQQTAHGRIRNGQLEAGPMDITLRLSPLASKLDGSYHALTLRGARLQVRRTADGGIKGMLGGYRDIEELYGQETHGGTVSGNNAMGYLFEARAGGPLTCSGYYKALYEAADGRDPKSGKCNLISMGYEIQGAKAFIMPPDPPRQARNRKPGGRS